MFNSKSYRTRLIYIKHAWIIDRIFEPHSRHETEKKLEWGLAYAKLDPPT
jgi:hypothetical protein